MTIGRFTGIYLLIGLLFFVISLPVLQSYDPRPNIAIGIFWPIHLFKFLWKALVYSITGKENW